MSVALHSLTLLSTLKEMYPYGISEFEASKRMVYALFSQANDADQVLTVFEETWPLTSDEAAVYVIDLQGIDLIGPSAASALAKAAVAFAEHRQHPVLFSHVEPEVLEGLQSCRFVRDIRPTVFAIRATGDLQIIGDMPERWRIVLSNLDHLVASSPQHNDGASASDLAERMVAEQDRRTINRYSVYLQELYSARLVNRHKVGGTAREGAERGWTYMYRPAYSNLGVRLGA